MGLTPVFESIILDLLLEESIMNIKKVKQLREMTYVSLAKCKEALEKSNWDVEPAVVELQRMGALKARSSARRETREGAIRTYVHGERIAVMVEVNCETDFTARNELFSKFCDHLAMQIAAMHPMYLTTSDVPVEIEANMRSIFRDQVPDSVPDSRVNHIVNGKMKKWYTEVCLMEQKSVVDDKGQTIEQCRANLVMQTGENIVVKRFVRWELGQ